jgi:Cu/Ag efflux protein CusF
MRTLPPPGNPAYSANGIKVKDSDKTEGTAMKKWTKLGIGLLCATLVTFGVRSISGVSNADEASQTVNGTVKTIDAAHGEVTVSTDDGTEKTVPLSNSVWVFLDDHKAQTSDLGKGFKVELILNGKKQVAYIKAISKTVTDKSGSAQAPVGTTDLVTASSSASAAATASATLVAPATGTSPTASSTPTQTAAPWDKLHIKIEGNGLTMDIQDKGDHNNGMSMIKMKPKGRDGLFLKGDDAEHWIRTLLAGIDLKAPNAQQQIKTAFINWFELNGTTLNVSIEVEAKPAESAAATSSTPAAPSTTSIPAIETVKAQITISPNNDDDGEEIDDDNEDNQGHDKQSKDVHKKVRKIKSKEKEHQDNGKHKGMGDKDD